MIEKSVCTNTRCFTCGSLVYAVEKKVTTNHAYHNRCFRCRICKRNLTGLSLNEEGDDIYCGNCYRKKQRGDCHSIEFQRAAAERAQFIYNDHHPDQPAPVSNLRPPVHHDLSRHPSWTLRQLERKFLSDQQPMSHSTQRDKGVSESSIGAQPLRLRASFSTPINLSQFRDTPRSSITDQFLPSLRFPPAYSPYPPSALKSPRTPREPQTLKKSLSSSQSGFDRTSLDLERKSSLSNGRKSSVAFDLKEKETRFSFPDPTLASTVGRNASYDWNRLISLRRMK